MRTPVSFSVAFAGLCHELPQNQTIMDLAYDFQGQMAIIEALQSEKWQQHRFVPLVGAGSNSRISLPLYAGDGLVVKITPQRYEPRQPMPYVLPPLLNQSVSGQYSDYWLTALPMVQRADITADDVADMAKKLKDVGYGFKEQDDRPDNLGRLPGSDLCIIDQGAVQSLRMVNAPKNATDQWLQHVYDIYGDVYDGQKLRPQTSQTDFDFNPMPSQKTLITLPPTPSALIKHDNGPVARFQRWITPRR